MSSLGSMLCSTSSHVSKVRLNTVSYIWKRIDIVACSLRFSSAYKHSNSWELTFWYIALRLLHRKCTSTRIVLDSWKKYNIILVLLVDFICISNLSQCIDKVLKYNTNPNCCNIFPSFYFVITCDNLSHN